MNSTQWYNGSLSCSPVGRTTLITSLLTNSSVQSTQMACVCISTFWIPVKQKLLIVFVIITNNVRTHSYSYWKSHGLWVSRSQIATYFGITRCEYHLFLWLIWLLSMRGGGNRPDGNNSWWSTHNIQSKIHTLCAQMYDAVHTLRIRLYGDIVVTWNHQLALVAHTPSSCPFCSHDWAI